MNILPLLPALGAAPCRQVALIVVARRRLILLTALLLISGLSTKAQDLVLKKDKTRIEATIVEITEDAVRYKRFDFPDGPLYNIKKSEVLLLVYKNGLTESFDAADTAPAPPPTQPAASLDPVGLSAPAAPRPAHRPVMADEPRKAGSGMVKNPWRLMGGAGLCDVAEALTFMGALEVLGANKKIGFLANFTNAGLGLAGNSMTELSHDADDGERLLYNKHYLSAYAFKEFDGRSTVAGLLLGPGLNYTNATKYIYADVKKQSVDIDTGFFTAGLHAGEYVQKYLWKNSKGERTGYLRIGLNQFLMLEGAFTSSFVIIIGI